MYKDHIEFIINNHRVRTLTSDSYIALLNTYSDHRALDAKTKDAFEVEMKTSIDEIKLATMRGGVTWGFGIKRAFLIKA